MKEIERYIQFAIDNGLNFRNFKLHYNDTYIVAVHQEEVNKLRALTYNLYELIASKPFIEAIARGYVENNNPTNYWEVEWIGKYKSEHWGLNTYDEIFEQITILQAIAIRDNKLEEFITNILPND